MTTNKSQEARITPAVQTSSRETLRYVHLDCILLLHSQLYNISVNDRTNIYIGSNVAKKITYVRTVLTCTVLLIKVMYTRTVNYILLVRY